MKKFIHFDGDDVGNHLELLLLDGRIDEAAALSDQITDAMWELRKSLEQIPGLHIHLFGGDDLIAAFAMNSISKSKLNDLRHDFKLRCGVTISVGVGSSVQDALINSRRAKLSGKDQVVGSF